MSNRTGLQFRRRSTSRSTATCSAFRESEVRSVLELLDALRDKDTREHALLLLSKNRTIHEDLALLLWHSVGIIPALLQEILSVYRPLGSPNLTERDSNRVCNALTLFQCIATHPDTKIPFIKADLPSYLYPFLNNASKERPNEYLRLSSLGVIGALVKVDDTNVILYLLGSQILPCCLHCMKSGCELAKTVATYILYKILANEEGLKYCCTIAERFFAIGQVLGKLVEQLAQNGRLPEDCSKRLLKHIIWCYHRLSESPRACDGLRCCFPVKLTDSTFISCLRDDQAAIQCLQHLIYNVSTRHQSRAQPVGRYLAN